MYLFPGNPILTQVIIQAVQGMGGGGLLSLTEIVIADLVPLHQRGAFVGISELFGFS